MGLSVQIDMVSYDHVALRWFLDPAPAEDVTFDIYRSGNPATGWELVRTGIDGAAYLDSMNLMARFRPVFYRVEAVVGADRIVAPVVSIEAPPNMTTMVLSRRERFQLAKWDGNPAWLFVKRQWGRKCTVCRTQAHGPVSHECTRCYGTGFDGGFYPPVPIWISVKRITGERTSLASTHAEQRDTNSFWTANWALITPEDLIIEAGPPFLVWIVEGVGRSAYNRSPLSHSLTVNTVERGHVYYDLPRPTGFQWPTEQEIWYESFSEGHKAFDELYAELLAAYLATNPKTTHDGIAPNIPDPGPVIQVEDGGFDPISGGFR